MSSESTNVFKFVSVRPVQLATESETTDGIIRDVRAGSRDGLAKLTGFARGIDSPGAAEKRWEKVHLDRLRPLAEGRRKLVEKYRLPGEKDPAPSGEELLREAGLGELDKAELWDEAWDALYTAYATGTGAGELLELPTAALRLLHYADALADDPTPTAAAALRRLDAQPAIAPQLDALLRPAGGKPPAPPEPSHADPSHSPLASRAEQLVSELSDSRELLASLERSAAASPPALEAGKPEEADKWSRQSVAVDTTPALEQVLGPNVSRAKETLLDRLGVTRKTSLPTATQALQDHVATLSDQAFRLAGQHEFEAGLERVVKFPLPTKPVSPPSDPSTAPDVDVHGRIKPLGIGDLKVVKQQLLAYEPGEVAYIENVLKGESKNRVFRTLDRTETTVTVGEEEVKETQRDTQTTERFELKREAAQTIKEDLSVKAGLSVTASYGPVSATAKGDFAYSNAKEESQKTSANFAREVVDRSISKIQTKVTSQRTTNTINEIEETDTHGVDNKEGKEHVVGIYRWVNKRYKAQVYNYGLRMMLEFIIPEPAAFYRAAHSNKQIQVDATPPIPFLNDLQAGQPQSMAQTLSASDIDETNYTRYAARYGAAGLAAPPPMWKWIEASMGKDSVEDGKTIAMTSKDLMAPDGYRLTSYGFAASLLWNHHPKFTVQVGDDLFTLTNDSSGGNSLLKTSRQPGPAGSVDGGIAASVATYDINAFTLTIKALCQRQPEAYAAWQLQTYDKIQAAYQAQKTAYDQKVAQAKGADAGSIQGHNPALNRSIIQNELKKLCITMMTGQHFGQFHAVTDPTDPPAHIPEVDVLEALREGPIVQFFEQAFEWEQMTYLFYPYFWGRKSKWADTTSKVEDPDPSFEQFLTAGSCRVVVPVPPAYAEAVAYMLQSPAADLAQKVWLGGEPPTIESPLYESLAEEIRNQTDDLEGAKPEGEPWEFTLPTTLVWLQPDATLPVFT
ncbi:MAG TPA: hypothetical protein VF009_09420 [Solirubrobacterales bacterium]